VDELGIAQSKISQSAQQIVDRAVAEFRRRGHAVLTNDHIFFAFAQLEWSSFSGAMRGLTVTPRELLQSLHEHLQTQPLFSDRKLRVSPVTKLVFKLAFHLAGRAGRQTIERSDLFLAILEEGSGATASFMRRYGLEPEVLASQIASRMQDINDHSNAVAESVQQQNVATAEILENVASAAESAKSAVSGLSEVANSTAETQNASQVVLTASESVRDAIDQLRAEVEKFLAKVAA